MSLSRVQKRAVMAKMAPIFWGEGSELGGWWWGEKDEVGNVGFYGRPSLLIS